MVVLGMNILVCSAAMGGHLEVLKWAHENGCPWNEYTCSSAARGGHLEVLKWARRMVVLGMTILVVVQQGGHLEVLKWARENGCPWDEHTCSSAARWTFRSLEMGSTEWLSLECNGLVAVQHKVDI